MNILEIREALEHGKTIYELPLNVAYYARVSTSKYEQLNSLENQVTYYENLIKSNSRWNFVGGFIDEGISGTSVKKRKSFLRMIREAKDGKIDLIITKEISRFARDTLDSIKYTRELLSCGVGIYFQNDNINTFDKDSELRLTILSSIAQEEVRKLSERAKFGFQRAIEKGSVLGNDRIWGYEKDKTVGIKDKKKLVIVEEEAEIIRKIFDMYVNSHLGMRSIGLKLASVGILNKNKKPFTQGTIKYILTNPKYKGYYCGNRTTVVDYHSKKRLYLNKEEWKLEKDDVSIPAIVSEEIWNEAQRILYKRSLDSSQDKRVYQNRYPFSGKIICMKHNTTYRRKVNTSSGIKKKKVVTWRCSNFLKYNTVGCDGPILYDSELTEIVGKTILRYLADIKIVDDLMEDYKKLTDIDYSSIISSKKELLEGLKKQNDRLVNLLVEELISKEEYSIKKQELRIKIEKLNNEIVDLESNNKNTFENIKYMQKVKEKALEKMKYENTNVNELIRQFLDHVEVLEGAENKEKIVLRVVLNTGKDLSISFNNKKHPFCTTDTYD